MIFQTSLALVTFLAMTVFVLRMLFVTYFSLMSYVLQFIFSLKVWAFSLMY